MGVEKILAAVAMAALFLITLANVAARYFTNYSFAFTEEYSVALMVAVGLLGTAIAARADRNIRITWFVDRLPRRLRAMADGAAKAATVGMFLLLAWLGGRMVWDEYRFEVTSPGLGEPQWMYTLVLPALSVVVAVRALFYKRRSED